MQSVIDITFNEHRTSVTYYYNGTSSHSIILYTYVIIIWVIQQISPSFPNLTSRKWRTCDWKTNQLSCQSSFQCDLA